MNIIPPISEGQCPSCACRLACWMRARFNDVDIISSVTCALSSSLVGGVSSWRCFCFEHCNGLKLNIDSLTVVYQKYWKYGAHNLQWNLKKKGSKSGAQNVQYASVPRWQSLLHNHLFICACEDHYAEMETERRTALQLRPPRDPQRRDLFTTENRTFVVSGLRTAKVRKTHGRLLSCVFRHVTHDERCSVTICTAKPPSPCVVYHVF
jgi:hypothetical protein